MRFVPLIVVGILFTSIPVSFAAVNNLARGDDVVYGSAGSAGLAILNATSGAELSVITAPSGFDGVHDVSVAASLLFVLDAAGGSLGVYDLSTPATPSFIDGSREDVDVGPFSGVSAGGGKVVVSGGTRLMSIFGYTDEGALTRLADNVDLGNGQPDVLVDEDGSFAYVSTDFSGNVDGSGFGVTTVDLDSENLDKPSTQQLGLKGAGFTDAVSGNANFPIESAIAGKRLLVAHGGGLAVLSLETPAEPSLSETVALDFPAVNVDADGDTAIVVGGESSPRAARVNLDTLKVENIELTGADGAGGATSVSVEGSTFLVAAGDEILACDEDCAGSAVSAGSSDSDSDVCVEEEYLLARGVARHNLLHKGSLEAVLCPGSGLPCGTASHVVRFDGEYMTYDELCSKASIQCVAEQKIVNGVSMRHAKLLCADTDVHCVVPHVMLTGFELERSLIRILHSHVIAWR